MGLLSHLVLVWGLQLSPRGSLGHRDPSVSCTRSPFLGPSQAMAVMGTAQHGQGVCLKPACWGPQQPAEMWGNYARSPQLRWRPRLQPQTFPAKQCPVNVTPGQLNPTVPPLMLLPRVSPYLGSTWSPRWMLRFRMPRVDSAPNNPPSPNICMARNPSHDQWWVRSSPSRYHPSPHVWGDRILIPVFFFLLLLSIATWQLGHTQGYKDRGTQMQGQRDTGT